MFDVMRRAVAEAKETMSAADQMANQLAGLLRGRLRHVQPWHLKALKKELQNFNAHTGRWKDDE
jgi:hypothetical protein